MTRELVLGASGLLGSALLREARATHPDVIGTYHKHAAPDLRPLDITDASAVDAFLRLTSPEVVYIAAADPNVEGVEADPAKSRAINVEAPLALAKRLAGTGVRLVYFSSDYVFDGTAGPYREGDPPAPLSEYGRQKLEVEQGLGRIMPEALIARVTVLYGWESQGKNFVHRLIASLREGKQVRVPSDQIGSPSYAPNVAACTRELALAGRSGVWHVAGPELAARDEFAREAARVFGLDETLIVPVATSTLSQRAARPLKAGMIVDKAQAALKTPLLGYHEGLRRMRQEGPS